MACVCDAHAYIMSKTSACSWIWVYLTPAPRICVAVEVLLLCGCWCLPCSSWLACAGATPPFLAQQQSVLGGIDAGWLWLVCVLLVLAVLAVLTLLELVSMAPRVW
jgi:hypothetical protein